MCYGCVVSSLKFARASCNSIYHIFVKDLLSFNSRFHRLHAERNWGLARYERTELRNDPCETGLESGRLSELKRVYGARSTSLEPPLEVQCAFVRSCKPDRSWQRVEPAARVRTKRAGAVLQRLRAQRRRGRY